MPRIREDKPKSQDIALLTLYRVIAAWDAAEYSNIDSTEDLDNKVLYWLKESSGVSLDLVKMWLKEANPGLQWCGYCKLYGQHEDWCDEQ